MSALLLVVQCVLGFWIFSGFVLICGLLWHEWRLSRREEEWAVLLRLDRAFEDGPYYEDGPALREQPRP